LSGTQPQIGTGWRTGWDRDRANRRAPVAELEDAVAGPSAVRGEPSLLVRSCALPCGSPAAAWACGGDPLGSPVAAW